MPDSWLGNLLSGAIKPEEISKAIQPILKDAEATIAEGVSTAIHSGMDRASGVKMKNVITIETTFEFPPAKAIPVEQ